jgi:hypothetical protein
MTRRNNHNYNINSGRGLIKLQRADTHRELKKIGEDETRRRVGFMKEYFRDNLKMK